MDPPKLHHVTLKTTRLSEMARWYALTLGMTANFDDPSVGAWLTNDAANHRLALLVVPGLAADDVRRRPGVHHFAFEFSDVGGLLDTYARLSDAGVTPQACLDHGMTTSMYYVDPDDNTVELQADNFGDWDASSEWMRTAPEFRANPVGVQFDPNALLAAWRAGADAAQLHHRAFAGEFDPGTPLDLRLPD